jgi:hypothetical protein
MGNSKFKLEWIVWSMGHKPDTTSALCNMGELEYVCQCRVGSDRGLFQCEGQKSQLCNGVGFAIRFLIVNDVLDK